MIWGSKPISSIRSASSSTFSRPSQTLRYVFLSIPPTTDPPKPKLWAIYSHKIKNMHIQTLSCAFGPRRLTK